ITSHEFCELRKREYRMKCPSMREECSLVLRHSWMDHRSTFDSSVYRDLLCSSIQSASFLHLLCKMFRSLVASTCPIDRSYLGGLRIESKSRDKSLWHRRY
ncbi:hypothetical protein PENTCL1PPCAC_11301, partial [Pristionchus entomophagus]